MSVFTWPASMTPRRMQLRVVPNVLTFTSPYSKSVYPVDLMGDYWRMQIDLSPGNSARTGGSVEAFFDRLKGPTNQVALWNFRRPVPLGTARGTMTLAANVAQLANIIYVTGVTATGPWLRYGRFETDTSGVGTGWTAYSAGTFSTPAYSRVGGVTSTYVQRVTAVSVGAASSDNVGVKYTASIPFTAGVTYTVSADIYGVNSSQAIEVDFYDDSNVYKGQLRTNWTGGGAGYDRRSLTGAAPAGATKGYIYIFMHSGTGASPEIRIGNVQVDTGSVATAYAAAPTLLDGDMLSVNGQLVRILTDSASDDSGTIALEVAPRIRAAQTAGASVVWNYPTAPFMLVGDAPVSWQPGMYDGPSLEFREFF